MEDQISKLKLIDFFDRRIKIREEKLKLQKYATPRVYDGGRLKELQELRKELEK